MFPLLKTTLLLIGSNLFMLCAWYLHPKMKFLEGRTIWLAIGFSWFVPFVLIFAGEKITWNYAWAALCLIGAAYFVFSGTAVQGS